MALAIDITSTQNTAATPSLLMTKSHTCTGTDLALFVGIGVDTAATTISGVTYNAVAMTKVGATVTNGNLVAEIYKLVAPATGAHNIIGTLSGLASAWMWGISFTGADQTDPADANNGGTGSGSVPSTSVTTLTSGDFVIDMVATDSNVTQTAGGSQTRVLNANNSSNAARGVGSNTTAVVTPAGSVTMSWSGSTNWAQKVVAVKPSGGTVATVKTLAAMGVG